MLGAGLVGQRAPRFASPGCFRNSTLQEGSNTIPEGPDANFWSKRPACTT